MSTLQGGCLCSKVRFTVSQPPLRTFACHCTFCQRVTGSAFYAESIFQRDAIQFNDGELRQYAHVSDGSQKKVFVHFCPVCGTTVGLTFERWPDMQAISRGCYDDPNAVDISSHIWTRSAQITWQNIYLVGGQPAQPARHETPVLARAPAGVN